jgi:hypothetical protein
LTGKKWERNLINSKQALADAQDKFSKGDHSSVLQLIGFVIYGENQWSDWSIVPGGIWNDKLGLPKEDLDTTLKNILA